MFALLSRARQGMMCPGCGHILSKWRLGSRLAAVGKPVACERCGKANAAVFWRTRYFEWEQRRKLEEASKELDALRKAATDGTPSSRSS